MTNDKKTVMVSGGFDPVHIGHIRMITEASKHGDVIVVANSDDWLYRKKGFVFMEFEQRAEILAAIKGVIKVSGVDDSFPNGGDRKKHNTPEQAVCSELGVEMLWGVGGDNKANSSSDLVERVKARRHVSER
jgi:D-beta-D-heptose 7-phosphate kinase/D-beta-D-heptose 1-phosphate adenosyltransferase